MAKRIQLRRGLAAAWALANPTLLPGEVGIETDTDKFKVGDGATNWVSLPYGGMQGPQGIQGIQGIQGPQGNAGSKIYSGVGAPSIGLGVDSDFYINESNGDYYLKASGAWGLEGNLQGPPGDNGYSVLNGSGAPSDGLGVNGDFYINTSNYYIYGPKAGGVWPAGVSLVGPSGAAADHELLTNLQGGGANHYHSDQPINVADQVSFNAVSTGDNPATDLAALEVSEISYSGIGNVSTSGSSTTVTTTGSAFSNAGLDSGSSITANGVTVTVDDVIDGNTVDVFPAVDWTGGFSWTYKNPTRVVLNKSTANKTASGVAFFTDSTLTWEQYTWPQEKDKLFYPAWNERAYTDNMIIHENGKIAIGGKPYQISGYKEPSASLEVYCHPFDAALNYDGSSYTDNTSEAKTSNGTSFDIVLNTNHVSYFGKYTEFSDMYISLSGVASSSNPTWEYWNGSAWTSLADLVDGTNNLAQSGSISWTLPTDWATKTVDTAADMYFVRVSVSALSGNVTANCALPLGGDRVNVYRAPDDPNPVFSVDEEGRTAIGKASANAQLDVVDSFRISSSDTGYFQLTVPQSGPSLPLITPTSLPTAGQHLSASSATQLAWVDDSQALYFGDGSDGDLTISSGTTTLSRDTFYNNVTISGTATISTAGCRLHVKGNLDLSNAPANAINWNGVSGGTSNGSGTGSAGSQRVGVTVGGSAAGGAGAAGATGAGVQGTATSTANPANGGASGASGKGGNNVSVPNAGGAARASAAASNPMLTPYPKIDFIRGATLLLGAASGGGGSSGGGDGTNTSRGGGGGGSGGGCCVAYIKNLITSGSTASGAIAALGGNGGAGGPTPSGNVGGGGGGGAGGGGFVYLLIGAKSGAAVTGLISVTGGTGGNGSNGAGTGIGGDGGNGGAGGRITVIRLDTRSVYQAFTGSGSAGTAGSGVTGGTGGAGGSNTYTL